VIGESTGRPSAVRCPTPSPIGYDSSFGSHARSIRGPTRRGPARDRRCDHPRDRKQTHRHLASWLMTPLRRCSSYMSVCMSACMRACERACMYVVCVCVCDEEICSIIGETRRREAGLREVAEMTTFTILVAITSDVFPGRRRS